MFGINTKREVVPYHTTDLHSHLLPGIDDGVKTFDESIGIIRLLQSMGYQKIITTPHIMPDFYPNSENEIIALGRKLKQEIKKAGIDIQLEVAAEYYLDENILERFVSSDELLLFGGNYLLFETSYYNEPKILREAIFQLNSRGINPVLAHPERYLYLQASPALVQELLDMQVYYQLNLLSLVGYYNKATKRFARKLIKMNAYSFLGSDCHNLRHAHLLAKALKTRGNYYINKQLLLNQAV
ncbi:MAG TPA: capsular biosynthesis protein [Cytophagales bacterium]|jgi:protein-tyrosine phosphatase|nr:capsular biosynthesis protein [Cytophagales bacterium]